MKKVIIFDFDGVIVDSWKHSYEMNLRDWSDLLPEQHKAFFNGNIHEEIEKLGPSEQSSEEKEKWMKEVYFPTKNKLPMFKGIDGVIKKIHTFYNLIINTSADAKSTQDFLVENNINYFDKVYGTEISKDKKIKFEKILTDYNVAGEDVLFITDTVGDVLDAKKFNMKVLVVTYGYQDKSYFQGIEDLILGFVDEPIGILSYLK